MWVPTPALPPLYFYSRPCGRGDQIRSLQSCCQDHFYSRPCGRGDEELEILCVDRVISTHAPAGGATSCSAGQARQSVNFYSRPCGRGDRETFLHRPRRGIISTHAPAGGATLYSLPS